MPSPDPIRLQKFLADTGVCSRRAAEEKISRGEVLVNGQPAVLGQKVVAGVDQVVVNGRPIAAEDQAQVTLAVHKPRGLVCSNEDPHNPETVFSLVPPEFARLRFFCAGRLDKESEGLVILTTDGDLAHRLMHPSHLVVKRYQATLTRLFPPSSLGLLVQGVAWEGERFKVEHAALLDPEPDGSSRDLDVHLHHGKKREIRQLFKALGFEVQRLRRYQIGSLRLEGIPLGSARALAAPDRELLFR
jgi:23S rRNA pseudouridine2605 synthase